VIREYPDTRQTGSYDCGDALVDGVLRFHGVRSSAAVLRLATEDAGLHPSTLYAMLRRAGLRVQAGTMSIDDLRHHTRLHRPVLCPIDLFGGHWVAVLGVTPKSVRYHCPTEGRKQTTHESWTRHWRDATIDGHAFDTWGIVAW